MSVSLREITPKNFKECLELKVADDQILFVAPNVKSIAISKVFPACLPFAVYADEQMVGFIMYGFDAKDGRFYLERLMIDEKFQGKGYGRAATLEVIERLKENADCKEIYLSFYPENTNAERLYKSIGFVRTGEISQGEIVMRYTIENNEQLTTNN
jgi:diamine N-acetyltransferase